MLGLDLVEKKVDPDRAEKKVQSEGAEKNEINDETVDRFETWLCASTSGGLACTAVVVEIG